MQLETINCPICDGADYELFLISKDFRLKVSNDNFNIVKCKKCDCIFLNPRPTRYEITRFYAPDFNKKDSSLLYKIIEPCFKIAQKSTIKLIRKNKKGGKVLDIGCGNGEFLLAMHKNDFDVWGVEPNRAAEKFSKKCIRGKILYKELSECNFDSNSFDVITMFQSLEHIYSLDTLFREINRILKDNGILYICVPNRDFFESHIFGSYYYNLEVPRHLYFFSKKTISNLLSKYGFKIELFLKDSIFEFVSTPASFYYGLLNFFAHKGITVNRIIKSLTFIPLVIIRFILRLFFIFSSQNLKVICRNKKIEENQYF